MRERWYQGVDTAEALYRYMKRRDFKHSTCERVISTFSEVVAKWPADASIADLYNEVSRCWEAYDSRAYRDGRPALTQDLLRCDK